jgi:uncharacterized repeat protein (TIGR01451 family)
MTRRWVGHVGVRPGVAVSLSLGADMLGTSPRRAYVLIFRQVSPDGLLASPAIMRNLSRAPMTSEGRARNPRRVGPWLLLLAAGAVVSCETASTINVLQIDATARVYGVAFVDANNDRVYDTGDQPLKNVAVLLKSGTSETVAQQVTTDSIGTYQMPDVPVGSYHVALSPDILGDSLQAISDSTTALNVQLGDDTRIDLGVSYPVLSVAEVRTLPAGKPVFTSGIALNPNLSYGDARLHIKGDTAYLRALNVARGAVQTGDSVRLQGRTAVDNGEPVLDDVTPFLVVSGARIPTPVDVGTATAATADGGRLDAALVRVRKAEILDTGTVNGDFQFHIDDGSGTLAVVVPSFLQIGTSAIFPDSILRVNQATGLLVPVKDANGQVGWQLYPRGSSDMVFEVKQIDVGVGMAVVPSLVAFGDTVRITVVATNAGPLAAVGVQIADTIPTGLGLVSASATKGSYDQATHRWSLDTLKMGDTDTLRLTTSVTTTVPTSLTNRAYFVRIRDELDTNSSNNAASATVTVMSLPKQADVRVQLGASPTNLTEGDTVGLYVTATNSGPFPATALHIADSIPAGLTFVDASASRGTYSATSGVWVMDTLRAGGAEVLTLRATVDPTATTDTLVDSAYVTGLNEVDPNPANNKATVSLSISPAPAPPLAAEVSSAAAGGLPPYPPSLSPMRRILPRVAGSTTLPKDGFTVTGTVTVLPSALTSMGFVGSTRRSALSTTPERSSTRLNPSTVR